MGVLLLKGGGEGYQEGEKERGYLERKEMRSKVEETTWRTDWFFWMVAHVVCFFIREEEEEEEEEEDLISNKKETASSINDGNVLHMRYKQGIVFTRNRSLSDEELTPLMCPITICPMFILFYIFFF